MSSTSSRRSPPRKGGGLQTDRRIHLTPERRDQIDVHHLGRALLRLAQERYDTGQAETETG